LCTHSISLSLSPTHAHTLIQPYHFVTTSLMLTGLVNKLITCSVYSMIRLLATSLTRIHIPTHSFTPSLKLIRSVFHLITHHSCLMTQWTKYHLFHLLHNSKRDTHSHTLHIVTFNHSLTYTVWPYSKRYTVCCVWPTSWINFEIQCKKRKQHFFLVRCEVKRKLATRFTNRYQLQTFVFGELLYKLRLFDFLSEIGFTGLTKMWA
jgi:hypothetical protein